VRVFVSCSEVIKDPLDDADAPAVISDLFGCGLKTKRFVLWKHKQ